MSGQNAGPRGPKEGAYLDAALERVRQELHERIDLVIRRRARWRIATTAGIASVALVGGAGIATALSAVPAGPAPAPRTTIVVGCDGDRVDAATGYFATTFSLPDSDAERVDLALLCGLAAERLVTDPADPAERSPAELLALAGALIRAADRGDAAAGDGRPRDATDPAALDVEVLRASFGAPESGR